MDGNGEHKRITMSVELPGLSGERLKTPAAGSYVSQHTHPLTQQTDETRDVSGNVATTRFRLQTQSTTIRYSFSLDRYLR